MKDRRLRPKDINCGIETIFGTIKLSEVGKHDFHQPNDPSRGLWTNKSLHDMAIYWSLPNIRDAQTCYFEEVNFGSLDQPQKDIYPIKPSIEDAIAEDGLERKLNYVRNYKQLSCVTSSLSAFLVYLLYLAA